MNTSRFRTAAVAGFAALTLVTATACKTGDPDQKQPPNPNAPNAPGNMPDNPGGPGVGGNDMGAPDGVVHIPEK